MKGMLLGLVLILIVAVAVPAVGANLVQNGGFEEPYVTWATPFGTGSTMGAWSVSTGTAYMVTNLYQANTAYEGQQYLQLMPATWVQQQMATVPGQSYKVSFAMSGAIIGGQGDHSMLAVWIANGAGTYVAECKASDGVWGTYEFTTTAVTDHDNIAFGNVALYPWIDSVKVEAVPEPAGAMALVTGLIGFAAVLRRARK